MAEREPGIYWVRHRDRPDEWSIAQWIFVAEETKGMSIGWKWKIVGSLATWQEYHFAELGERAQRHVTIPFTGQPFYIDATRDMKPRAGRVIHVHEGEPQPWREISGISVSQSEMIGTNERLIEVMEIFQRGCANTQPFGKPPTDCPECKLGFLEVVRDILFPVNESVEDVKP